MKFVGQKYQGSDDFKKVYGLEPFKAQVSIALARFQTRKASDYNEDLWYRNVYLSFLYNILIFVFRYCVSRVLVLNVLLIPLLFSGVVIDMLYFCNLLSSPFIWYETQYIYIICYIFRGWKIVVYVPSY